MTPRTCAAPRPRCCAASRSRGREMGVTVVFLPQELPPSAAAMLRELPDAGIRVVAGLTGDERADAGVLDTLRRLGAGLR